MSVEVNDVIPPFVVEAVSPEKMKTVSAIFRDPTPIHFDPDFVASRGAGHRTINQTPLNVGYILNMLIAWAGPSCVRRIRCEFPNVVFAGDRVEACGRVSDVSEIAGERIARCEVWLEHADGRRAVEGFAEIALPS